MTILIVRKELTKATPKKQKGELTSVLYSSTSKLLELETETIFQGILI